MRYVVYLRDWYYNAGIIGFLNVLSEGERNISNVTSKFDIMLHDNHIEFDSDVLSEFLGKYKKLAFDIFFDIDNYKKRINSLVGRIQQPDSKLTKKILQEVALNGKAVNAFIKDIYGKDLNDIFSDNDIVSDIQNVHNKINEFHSNVDVYKYLNDHDGAFIKYFLDIEVAKRICSYENIMNYIEDLSSGIKSPKKNEQRCFICGDFKKEYDLNNAVTQISGFNKDNANWIWGFQSSKAGLCALCALMYACALHGIVFISRKIGKDYKTFFYALNRNTDISTLYHSYWIFREKINQKENQNKPFYTILQEVTVELINQQTHAVAENINFIEVSENQFGGQGTKAYNVYNYNITKELAGFLQSTGIEHIPRGYYNSGDYYSDITEEILKKTLAQSLNFSDLARYFDYFIRSLDGKSKIKAHFSIYKVMKYILKYINQIKGEKKMSQEQQNQIVSKAFYNGKFLGEKIGQDNKLKGISYQLLNDLKISDRNSFLDKYLRLSMAYGTELKLCSHNELIDIDNFMSFGYAFVNGLLSIINANNNQEGQNE